MGGCMSIQIGAGFILKACCVTSTLHVPFCLTMAVRAGVARPSSGDRWSLLEKGHSTVLSARGVPLEPPRTNAVSFCWEHTGAAVCETSIGVRWTTRHVCLGCDFNAGCYIKSTHVIRLIGS